MDGARAQLEPLRWSGLAGIAQVFGRTVAGMSETAAVLQFARAARVMADTSGKAERAEALRRAFRAFYDAAKFDTAVDSEGEREALAPIVGVVEEYYFAGVTQTLQRVGRLPAR